MLDRVTPCALLLAVLAWPAAAEPLRWPADAKPVAKSALSPRPPKPEPCAAFGPGFVRIEGSDSCIRLGGSTSIGGGIGR